MAEGRGSALRGWPLRAGIKGAECVAAVGRDWRLRVSGPNCQHRRYRFGGAPLAVCYTHLARAMRGRWPASSACCMLSTVCCPHPRRRSARGSSEGAAVEGAVGGRSDPKVLCSLETGRRTCSSSSAASSDRRTCPGHAGTGHCAVLVRDYASLPVFQACLQLCALSGAATTS